MDEEAVEFTSESAPLDIIRPKIQRQDSCTSSRSRGRERHISSDHLEKMVLSIIEAKLPLNAPLPKILPSSSPVDEVTKLDTPPQPERSGSTTPESPCKGSETPSLESPHSSHPPETAASPSSTTVIRGFSPSHHDLHRVAPHHVSRIPSLIVIPEPTEAPAAKTVPPKKQQAKFALGASSGSGDDSYSDAHNSQMCKQPIVQPKKKIFQVGGSSDEDGSVKSDIHPSRANLQLPVAKKTASFNKQPVTRTFHPLRMPSDNEQSETDYIDESAIDDDDDDEWEDSVEESGKSSMDEKINFQRVDSKANLTSRRSLLTLMLSQNVRQQKLGNVASQSTSAIYRSRQLLNGPSVVASPNDSDDGPLMMKRTARIPPMRSIHEMPRSTAQPIMTPAVGPSHQAALSPRTTRRNMLATELTESLRRHLLWERSQKTQVANAVLKRRHTSQDVANLRQYPESPCLKKENDANANSWDEYFNKESFTGYHAQGW